MAAHRQMVAIQSAAADLDPELAVTDLPQVSSQQTVDVLRIVRLPLRPEVPT